MLKSKLPGVTDSIFTVMNELAQQYGAINLSQGFPNFKVDPILKELLQKAVQDDKNQYAPMQGLFSLRAAISGMTQQVHGAFYNPENEICLTAGATQAIFTAIQATVHTGDEVILFAPAYDCYEPAIILAGATAVPITLSLPHFKADWQQVADAITPRTRMIVINSPHNPSGVMWSHEDMLELQRLAVAHDLLVISDEVYEYIAFDNRTHHSASRYEGLKERCFVIGSFGKTFHITGWKIGYCQAPAKLMAAFFKVHQYVVFCVNHPMQDALATYLEQPARYLDLGTYYQRKRDLFLSLIEKSKFTYMPAHGSYFQLLDYSAISKERDHDFARKLTIENKIASIPISVFMENKDTRLLRFCFAKEDDELLKAAAVLNGL
jgi:methionine aminotransferase